MHQLRQLSTAEDEKARTQRARISILSRASAPPRMRGTKHPAQDRIMGRKSMIERGKGLCSVQFQVQHPMSRAMYWIEIENDPCDSRKSHLSRGRLHKDTEKKRIAKLAKAINGFNANSKFQSRSGSRDLGTDNVRTNRVNLSQLLAKSFLAALSNSAIHLVS